METLAQRVAKRAMASTSDKPPAGTPHTPVVVEISPDNSPRHSPSLSPQRESITDFSPMRLGACILVLTLPDSQEGSSVRRSR